MNITEDELVEAQQRTFGTVQGEQEEYLKEIIIKLLRDELETLLKLNDDVDYSKAPFQELPPLPPSATTAQIIQAVNYVIAYINAGVRSD